MATIFDVDPTFTKNQMSFRLKIYVVHKQSKVAMGRYKAYLPQTYLKFNWKLSTGNSLLWANGNSWKEQLCCLPKIAISGVEKRKEAKKFMKNLNYHLSFSYDFDLLTWSRFMWFLGDFAGFVILCFCNFYISWKKFNKVSAFVIWFMHGWFEFAVFVGSVLYELIPLNTKVFVVLFLFDRPIHIILEALGKTGIYSNGNLIHVDIYYRSELRSFYVLDEMIAMRLWRLIAIRVIFNL